MYVLVVYLMLLECNLFKPYIDVLDLSTETNAINHGIEWLVLIIKIVVPQSLDISSSLVYKKLTV